MKKIALTQGKFALVDDEDFEWLSQWKWYCDTNQIFPNKLRAARRSKRLNGKSKILLMHREILHYCGNGHIDHIDGDGLNNQKYNLRISSIAENIRNQKLHKNNTSGYKGVTWFKYAKKWMAQIMVDRKHISLGYFDDKLEAAKAYDKASKLYHGKYGRTNF